ASAGQLFGPVGPERRQWGGDDGGHRLHFLHFLHGRRRPEGGAMITALVSATTFLAQSSTGSAGCSIGPGGSRVIGTCTANNSLRIPVAYSSILPILVLSVGALLLLVLSAVLPKRSRPGLYAMLTAVIGAVAAVAAAWQWADIGNHHAKLTIGQQII